LTEPKSVLCIKLLSKFFESSKKTLQNKEKTENTPNPKKLNTQDFIENKNSGRISPLQTGHRFKKDDDILETNETRYPKTSRALSKKSTSTKSADKKAIDLKKSKVPSQRSKSPCSKPTVGYYCGTNKEFL